MQLEGKTILIVDDEETLTEVMSMTLEAEGAKVYIAHDGQEGFRLATLNNPDLITMDLKMPGVNGFEAIASLRMIAEDKPIIVVSAFNDEENTQRALEAGANMFLHKPFKSAKLIEGIVSLLKAQ